MVGVDSTSCRAHQHAAGSRKATPRVSKNWTTPRHHRPDEGLGRSRGGLTCKLHLAGEGGCRPVALLITPGQWGDAPQMIEVLDRIRVPGPLGGRSRTRPDHVSGDKAYSSRRNRRYLRRRDIKHTIPEPKDQRANRRRKAARAEDLPASTLTATSAATRSSGLSTTSRTLALSQPVTTSEPMSSMAPSPQQQSASGSSRELPGLASHNPGAGMKLGHHEGTPPGHGGVAAPSQKIERTHQTTPRSVTARAKAWRRGQFPRRAPTATQTSSRTVQRPGMNSHSRKPLLAALFTPTSHAVHDLPRSMAADTARSSATAAPSHPCSRRLPTGLPFTIRCGKHRKRTAHHCYIPRHGPRGNGHPWILVIT
ncbi:DDE family transposase [Streptomyces sp. T12]|nr:DDE family transposase [Streptomyces sp. T12]